MASEVVSAKAAKRVIDKHRERLQQEIQLANLRPSMLKHMVLSQEELAQLMNDHPDQRNKELIKLLSGKPDAAVMAFVRCLKESRKHDKLAELFDQEMQGPQSSGEDEGDGNSPLRYEYQPTCDKLAVLLSMDEYIIQINQAPPTTLSLSHHSSRDKLKTCLASSGFEVYPLSDMMRKEEEMEEEAMQLGDMVLSEAPPSKLLRKTLPQALRHVARSCKEDAIVLLYVSLSGMGKGEIVAMEELMQWLQVLPTSLVTMVIDSNDVFRDNQEFPWAQLTKWNSRAVVYSLSSSTFQVPGSTPPPHGLMTELFVKAFMSWLLRGSPAMVTHRVLYEQMSYCWYGHMKQLHFSPLVQGDVDRTFLGRDGYPYRQWLRADLISSASPSSPKERFDLTRVHIRTSKMAGLMVGDMLDVFHICWPEEVFKGKVVEAHLMYAIVTMENNEALAKMLEKEYQGLPSRPVDFLCLRKTFPPHVKVNYTVYLDGLDPDDEAKLRRSIDTSPLLTTVASKESKIVVRKEGQSYTIEDCCADVTYKPKVKNIVHIPSLLEMMAWFKFVKSIHPDQPQTPPTCSCYLTPYEDRPLLSPSSIHTIGYSSHTGGRLATVPIINFDSGALFWVPSGDDPNPHMQLDLQSNCVITAVEMRGRKGQDFPAGRKAQDSPDPSDVGVKYCEIVFSNEFECNDEGELCLELKANSFVGCVSLERSRPAKEEDTLWNLRFISAQGSAVRIAGRYETAWRELSCTLFMEGPVQLTKLEIRAPHGHVTGKVKVRVHSTFVQLCKIQALPISGSPRMHRLGTPVVASMLLLSLVHRPQAKWCPTSLQVQLYGLKGDKIVEVEEREKVTFWFTNHGQCEVYFSVLCLEETGKIQLVFNEVAPPGGRVQKVIMATIPNEHNVPAITDTYKVFVSPKMMYLEPYIQRGLHELFSPLHYDVRSYGTRSMDKRDRWDQFEFKVRIRKTTH